MAKRSTTTMAAGTKPAATRTAADNAADQAEADRVAAEKAAADQAELGGFDMDGRTIFVRSVSPLGRRRAGMAFGPVPVPIEVDDLSEDQLAAILADTDHLVIVLDN